MQADEPSDCSICGGNTSLHIAASIGNAAAVAVLLQHGDRTDLANADGATPLDLAASNGHLDALLCMAFYSRDWHMWAGSLHKYYHGEQLAGRPLNQLECALMHSCTLGNNPGAQPRSVTFCKRLMQRAIDWSRAGDSRPASSSTHLPAFTLLLLMLAAKSPQVARRCGDLLPALGAACIDIFMAYMGDRVYETELDFFRGMSFGLATAMLLSNNCMFLQQRTQTDFAAPPGMVHQMQASIEALASFLNSRAWTGWARDRAMGINSLVELCIFEEVNNIMTLCVMRCAAGMLKASAAALSGTRRRRRGVADTEPALVQLMVNVRWLLLRNSNSGLGAAFVAEASNLVKELARARVQEQHGTPCFEFALAALVLLLPMSLDELQDDPADSMVTTEAVLLAHLVSVMGTLQPPSWRQRLARALIATLLPAIPRMSQAVAAKFLEPCLRPCFAQAGLADMEPRYMAWASVVASDREAVPCKQMRHELGAAGLCLTDLLVDLGVPDCHYHRCNSWPHQQQEAQPRGYMICRDCLKARFCSEKCARDAWAWGHHHRA